MIYGDVNLNDDERLAKIYNKFISECMNIILEDFDGKFDKHFRLRSDPELDADIVGLYERGKTKAKVYVYLTNVRPAE